MVEVFVEYNPNKHKRNRVGDCAVRALSKALGQTWDETFVGLALKGFELGDMPSSNHIWGTYLKEHGFTRHAMPAEYAVWYTVSDFEKDNPKGTYILGLDGHVVCVQDGNLYDTWNSEEEHPIFYWAKKEGA